MRHTVLFCIQLFGNSWTGEEWDTRQNSFTKANLMALQTLQNKVLRLLTGKRYDTPTADLFSETEFLSVNQLIAYSTLVLIFKIKNSGEPVYLSKRLGFRGEQQNGCGVRPQNFHDINIDLRLARGREGMLYPGSKLWNSLDISLKQEKSVKSFKKLTKAWIRNHIPLKPTINGVHF